MELKHLRREVVYRGQILEIWADEVEYASGTRTVREVVHHPGGSAVLPLFDDGRILLIEQLRYPLAERILELPAGRLEPGEDPAVTAVRELEEETGWTAQTLEKLASAYTSPGYTDEVVHIYLARKLSPVTSLHPGEEGEQGLVVHEMTIEKALEGIQSGVIRDCKTIVGLLLARNFGLIQRNERR